mgnify:CR=1 FL=1
MLIHYCVIAFKNIWKYKVSASISILGLAFALVLFRAHTLLDGS